jgi:hypothetical protein
LFADRFDTAGDVHAQARNLGFAQPESWDNEANHVRQAGHHMPDAPIQPSRTHAHHYLIIRGHWLLNLPQLEHLDSAVPVLDDGLHGDSQ